MTTKEILNELSKTSEGQHILKACFRFILFPDDRILEGSDDIFCKKHNIICEYCGGGKDTRHNNFICHQLHIDCACDLRDKILNILGVKTLKELFNTSPFDQVEINGERVITGTGLSTGTGALILKTFAQLLYKENPNFIYLMF